MNTIAIDSNIYKGAESYAKLHNRDALSYVKTLKAKGGKPIPADENSLDALVEKKIFIIVASYSKAVPSRTTIRGGTPFG